MLVKGMNLSSHNGILNELDILHVLGRLFDLPHIIEEARGLGHDGNFTNLTL